ncbi:MAG TPA: tRNA epoxyqueuosine(34) reductase QueG [Stenotrophomonas sp.]|jgi:epoxyqueuosine reductase
MSVVPLPVATLPTDPAALSDLAARIRQLARQAGFQRVGISGIALEEDEQHLRNWLDGGLHGSMHWMAHHGDKRSRPQSLVPGTLRVISVGLDYGRLDDAEAWATLATGERAYVARYALGRDYHKLMRHRLQKLAEQIQAQIGPFGHRVFVDSAPVLERALARNAGLGWIGKHTCLIDKQGGSWFFLGEIFVDLPLPIDVAATGHCGTCVRCIDICPTGAIIGPHRLDARRCISYLTIEHEGAIPEELRALIGNRIFGCDDCQLVCPWNKFAQRTDEADFRARNDLDRATLPSLFAWDEDEFLRRTEGSPIRRSGHERWLRNIAVALGNAPTTPAVLAALASRSEHASPLVREHVGWALAQHRARRDAGEPAP